MILGKVTNREVTESRESDGPVLLLQVELTNERDVQDAELFKHAGVDYNPPDGSFVVIIPLANAFKVAVAADDGIESEADPGEYEIYSSENGEKLAKVKCNLDGEVIHNDGERLVARKEDETLSNVTIDPVFWAWITAVNTALGLPTSSLPTALKCLIDDGSETVKVP